MTLATATTAILNAALPTIPSLLNKIPFGGITGKASKSEVQQVLTQQRTATLDQVKASATSIQKVAEEVETVRQFVAPAVTANETIATMLAIIPDNSANINDATWNRLKEEWEVTQASLEQVKGININNVIATVTEIELITRLRQIQGIQNNDRIRIANIINQKDASRLSELRTRLNAIQAIVRESALVGDTELRRLKQGIDAMAVAMSKMAEPTPSPTPGAQ
jgi:hypothetical protein